MSPANDTAKTVFDASAVLALLQEERGSEQLKDLQANAVVYAVNLAEVLAKLISKGVPPAGARMACEALHLETAPFDPELAAASAEFVYKGVSLGDRCFLAAAMRHGSGWTSDHALVKAPSAREGVIRFFR